MAKINVPDVVIRRLPLYLRTLTYMEERGQQVISSAELGERTGFTPAQIRRDLSYFGEFGKQGLGYQVSYLRAQLESILHADQEWHLAVIGAGALGHALVNYRTFQRWKYRIQAVFDNDPQKIGQAIGSGLVNGLVIQPMSELRDTIRQKHIEIAIIAVPAEHAQEVAEQLVASGVRAILNYAPINLTLPPEVHVSYSDPVVNLQSITYYLQDSD